MQIRVATPRDAEAVSAMLREIAAAGKRTRPCDPAFVLATYIENPNGILCLLALDEDGTVLGLQSLSRATAGNAWGTEPGWGIIGTHVGPRAARRGVGKALFVRTLEAAKAAGLPAIDASIAADNAEGLGYYEAMGFRARQESEGRINKAFRLRDA